MTVALLAKSKIDALFAAQSQVGATENMPILTNDPVVGDRRSGPAAAGTLSSARTSPTTQVPEHVNSNSHQR